MAVDLAEEAVDIDLAKTLGHGDVVFRRQILVAEKQHPVIAQRLAEIGDHAILQIARQINAVNIGADTVARFNVHLCHGPSPSQYAYLAAQ